MVLIPWVIDNFFYQKLVGRKKTSSKIDTKEATYQ